MGGGSGEESLEEDADGGKVGEDGEDRLEGEAAGPNGNETRGVSNIPTLVPDIQSLDHLDHNSAVMRKRERTDSDRVFYAELDDTEGRPRREPGSSPC